MELIPDWCEQKKRRKRKKERKKESKKGQTQSLADGAVGGQRELVCFVSFVCFRLFLISDAIDDGNQFRALRRPWFHRRFRLVARCETIESTISSNKKKATTKNSALNSSILDRFGLLALGFTQLYRVFPIFDEFNRFYWVLLGFNGFYWVLLGFTGFYWVLRSFT